MTNKVVYKTLNILYTKRKIFREKKLNLISSFIIFNLSDTFFVGQIKSKKFVSFIKMIRNLNIFQKRYCLNQRLQQNKLSLLQKYFSKYLPFCVRNVLV